MYKGRVTPRRCLKMVKNKKDLISPRRTKVLRRSLTSTNSTGSANFKVIVRVRPRNEKELNSPHRPIVKLVDTNVLVFDPKEEDQPFFYHGVQQQMRDLNKKINKNVQFLFDSVFGPESSNDDIFAGSTKSLIKTLMNGYNCSVFVYGATGAGKTHTMIGHNDSPGITYLTMNHLFDQIDSLRTERDFDLDITYLEVYNEAVNDLLNPGEPLHLREDGKYGVCVAGLTMKRITNPTELFDLLKKGNGNRTQHPTDANAESSRSHAVFQVYINMKDRKTNERNFAKLSMIDLAGSERGAATGCSGMRFTEGANINKSLLALGNCINSLADGQRHVPYRDSKLTRLLKDSLGGNCQTVMIANVSPAYANYEDTYNTLKYATRAKKIKTCVKRNVIKNDLTIPQYKKLIEELTRQNELLTKKSTDLELKLKTQDPPEATCSCSKVSSTISGSPRPPETITRQTLPEIVVESTESIAAKENFKQMFREKEMANRQILRLEIAEEILILRQKFKESTENKLRDLCMTHETFEKSKNRIHSTVESCQQQISSIKYKLKDLHELKTKLEANIEIAKLSNNDTFINELQNASELEYYKQKIQNCNKIMEMFQVEVDHRDKVEEKMINLLKPFYMMLDGYGHLTEAIKHEYQSLVHVVQGVRTVSWQDDECLTTLASAAKNNCTAIISALKHTSASKSENLSTIQEETRNRRSSVRCRLYSETDVTPGHNQTPVAFNSERKATVDTNLDETFNMLQSASNQTFQIANTPNSHPKRFKKEVTSARVVLPEVCVPNIPPKHITTNAKSLLSNKENKSVTTVTKGKFMTERGQKYPLRQHLATGVTKTIVKKTVRPTKGTLLESKDKNKNLPAKRNLPFSSNSTVKFRQ